MRPPTSIAFMPLLLVLGACGGGGKSSSSNPPPSVKGSATLTVAWPTRSRGVPFAANSLVVALSIAGKPVSQTTVLRPAGVQPTSKATLDNLPFGTLSYTITAYPTTNGTGVAQATGSGNVKVAKGAPGTIPISLASTVRSLTVSQEEPQLGLEASANVEATAKDAAGNVVLLSALGGVEPIAWTSDAPDIAEISGVGPKVTIQGVAEGTTTLHAAFRKDDAGGTITATATVTVASTTGVVTIQ